MFFGDKHFSFMFLEHHVVVALKSRVLILTSGSFQRPLPLLAFSLEYGLGFLASSNPAELRPKTDSLWWVAAEKKIFLKTG